MHHVQERGSLQTTARTTRSQNSVLQCERGRVSPPPANRISLSRKTSAPAGSSVSDKRLKLMSEMGLEAWFINRLCLLCFSTNYISKGAKITKSKRKNGSCYFRRSCCQIFYLNAVNLSLAAQQSITMEIKCTIFAKTFQRMKTLKAKSKLGRFYFLIFFSFPGDFIRGPPCFSSLLWFCEETCTSACSRVSSW